MKWRNSKERELLSTGGSRESTLPNKSNPNPDLSDVRETEGDKRGAHLGVDNMYGAPPVSPPASPSSMPGSPIDHHDAMMHLPLEHEHEDDLESEIDSDEEITVS